MALSKKQLDIMMHTSGGGTFFRNHFVTGQGTPDLPIIETLVEAGLMAMRDLPGLRALCGGDDCYYITEAGRDALAAVKGD